MGFFAYQQPRSGPQLRDSVNCVNPPPSDNPGEPGVLIRAIGLDPSCGREITVEAGCFGLRFEVILSLEGSAMSLPMAVMS
jgi:hypothetical protein